MNLRKTWLVVLLLTGGCVAGYGDPILVIDPKGGAVTGAPGQTVGWGFSVTNDTPYYLLFDASYFCQPGQDPQFTTCTQTLGTYSDLIAYNFTEVAPMSTSPDQPFDLASMTGFGDYAISSTASVGSVDTGNLIATYMEYDGDPFDGGSQVSGDIEIDAPASVTVTGSTPGVPEPSSWTMLAAGLAAVGWRLRRR